MITALLIAQCALIGLSAFVLANHPSPLITEIHVTLIAVNVMFGLVNVRNLTR